MAKKALKQMEIQFKTPYNSIPEAGETLAGVLPSLTVPDQTMSIAEIMSRHARGLPLGGVQVPVYNGEELLPDIRKMDLAEQQQYREQFAAELEELKEKARKEHAENQRKKQTEIEFEKNKLTEKQKLEEEREQFNQRLQDGKKGKDLEKPAQ